MTPNRNRSWLLALASFVAGVSVGTVGARLPARPASPAELLQQEAVLRLQADVRADRARLARGWTWAAGFALAQDLAALRELGSQHLPALPPPAAEEVDLCARLQSEADTPEQEALADTLGRRLYYQERD